MLALVAVGCGDDRGAPGDATPDAPEPTVSVRITRQSVPLAGLAVFFHAADGSLVSSTTTDSDGFAEERVGLGGSVSAVTDFAATTDIKSFVNVTPGERFTIDGAPNLETPMTDYTVRVTPVAGAVFYRVSVRCLVGTGESIAPNTNPIDLPVTTTCLEPTETLVTALDSLGFPIESIVGAEATPTANGVVDLTNEVATPAGASIVTLANVPAQTELESARSRGRLQFLAETEPANNGDHLIVFPDFAGARQTIAVTGERPIYVWDEASSAQTIDVAALQVAPIMTPNVDRATQTVSWAGGASASFAFGQLFVDNGETLLWSFSGPLEPGTAQLTLPALAEFPLATATRIDVDVGVARTDARDELHQDGTWVDANNGVVIRQRALLRAPRTAGSAGLAFIGANLTF